MKAPEFSNNKQPFANTIFNAKYHAIESQNLSNTPNSSLRTRDPDSFNLNRNKYLFYSLPTAKDNLNISFDYNRDASVFPRDLYVKSPFAYSTSYLIAPRDINYMYTYSPTSLDGKERSTHTETASRFGYDRFYNEYGVGTQSRGYIEPPECHKCGVDTPKDTAPSRFYDDFHINKNYTEFRRMNDPRNPIGRFAPIP